MKKPLRCALGAFALMSLLSTAEGAAPAVVPALREWTGATGTTRLPNTRVKFTDPSLAEAAKLFAEDLAAMHLAPASSVGTGEPAILLSLAKDAKLGDEGYRLEIGATGVTGVTISAPTKAGVFYGTRTLLQMLKVAKGGELPCGVAADFPDYPRRMLMLDVARKPFTVATLKDYMRMMAWHKMNELHLHLCDESFGGRYSAYRIESRQFPGLTAKDFFYTFADLREIQDFAHDRGITVTPEVDMPGHASALTGYWPELANPKLPKSNLDVLNPGTVPAMKALLSEVIPLFDAPDFHIGTDEYRMGSFDKNERERAGEAFRKFIDTMNAFVVSKGKNCRIWSGFEYMPGTTLPDPAVTIDMWIGNDAGALVKAGHKVINSGDGSTYIVPGAHYYGVSNSGAYAGWEPGKFSKDPAKNPPKNDPHVLGGKLHVWNDQGPAGYTREEIADLVYPTLQVFAEKMWGTKGSKDYNAFRPRAEAVSPVPGVGVFDRLKGDSPEVFFSAPEERTLADVNAVVPLPLEKAERADLESPWTLTVEVMKTADTGKRGVILSSDLVEICSDFTRTKPRNKKGPDGADLRDAKGKPVVENHTVSGIGLVRAAGAFGKDPLDAVKSGQVSEVYGAGLPLDRWVKLTIVGEGGRTTVFVDGKKNGSSNNRMVCPLRRLGSLTGNSFVGKVRNLTVYDRVVEP